jgi:hypothetical protein
VPDHLLCLCLRRPPGCGPLPLLPKPSLSHSPPPSTDADADAAARLARTRMVLFSGRRAQGLQSVFVGTAVWPRTASIHHGLGSRYGSCRRGDGACGCLRASANSRRSRVRASVDTVSRGHFLPHSRRSSLPSPVPDGVSLVPRHACRQSPGACVHGHIAYLQPFVLATPSTQMSCSLRAQGRKA